MGMFGLFLTIVLLGLAPWAWGDSPAVGAATVVESGGSLLSQAPRQTLVLPLRLLPALDRELVRAIERPEGSPTRRAADRIRRLGEPRTLWLVLAVLYVTGNRTDRRAVVDSLSVGAQISLTTRVAKIAFGRGRPRQGNGRFRGPCLNADSFPSGHTALAFGVASTYACHRRDSAGVAYGLASLVGWSRIAEGSHWPTDVAAGAALGIALGQSGR
jgi:membrane-associated phospholipid phosphatase